MPQLRLLISSVVLVGAMNAGGAIASSAVPIASTISTVKIDTVQCPTGTVYRGGSENPCQQPSLIDVCSYVSRQGRCDKPTDELKEYHPPADIGGPSRSQGSGTRNKPH